MKKYILPIFIVFSVFMFISCGGDSKKEGSSSNNPEESNNSDPVTTIKVEGKSVTVLCQCDNKAFVRGAGDDQTLAEDNAKSKCSDQSPAVKNCRSL